MPYPLFHPASSEPEPAFLTGSSFRAAFPHESQYVEFKEGLSASALQDAVVAFSNADGGVVLIGVRDSGDVLGRDLTPSALDDIHSSLRQVRDSGRYTIRAVPVESRSVIAVGVARRIDGFAQTPAGRVLARRGTMKVPLFGDELRRLINERAVTPFESTPTSSSLGAVSAALLHDLVEAFGWRDSVEQHLEEHGLIDSTGMVTVAGCLYLLDDAAPTLGKPYTEILRYPAAGSDYDRRLEFRGPLHHQLQRVVAEIMDQLGQELVVLGIRRHELPRLPEVVVRETIANALAHRSYEASGAAVRVESYPHELRVVSPGGLPEPVTVETMRDAQAARNPRTIAVLRRYGLAEDVGRGIDVILDSMQREMLDPPRFEDTGHAVIVTLPIRSAVAPSERAWLREVETRGLIEPRDRVVLVHAARGEALSNARVRDLLGVGADAARRSLRRLRDADFLVQQGVRGGATYVLKASLRPPAGLRLSQEALEDILVELASAAEPLTNARVRLRTRLDAAEARRLLRGLVEQGRLVQEGQRRGTRYRLPGDVDVRR